MIHLALLLLLGTGPSAQKTSWMTPESFHNSLRMKRTAVLKQLKKDGWKWEKGKVESHLVIPYQNGKTVTLGFEKDRLRSIRFELVDFFPAVKAGFREQKQTLNQKRGSPAPASNDTVLIYEDRKPNVHVVVVADTRTDFGKQGVGFLVVRYFEPVARTPEPAAGRAGGTSR